MHVTFLLLSYFIIRVSSYADELSNKAQSVDSAQADDAGITRESQKYILVLEQVYIKASHHLGCQNSQYGKYDLVQAEAVCSFLGHPDPNNYTETILITTLLGLLAMASY